MSEWIKLEGSLRRLMRLRELGAPQDVIDNEIALAKRHWSRVPLTPAGASLVWPPELLALARELGFDPDTRGAGPRDPAIDRGVAIASKRQRRSAEIHAAIEAAGGVRELNVLDAGAFITLKGKADSADASTRAAAIAQRIAPDVLGIDNKLVVDAT